MQFKLITEHYLQTVPSKKQLYRHTSQIGIVSPNNTLHVKQLGITERHVLQIPIELG
jgi:hypothetical protein